MVRTLSLIVVLVAAPAQADDKKAKGPADLQGTWKLLSVEANEKTADPVGGGTPRWTVEGDTISYGGAALATLTADETTSPRTIDLKFRDPDRVYEGVYAVEKDTLKVCLNGRGDAKERPGAFGTKDKADYRLLVFEREKTPPASATDGLPAFAGVQLRLDGDDVVVNAPLKDSPADKAGVKAGDVLVRVGGSAVEGLDGAIKAVRAAKPGDKLILKVRRDGKEQDISVSVAPFPFALAVGLE